MKWGNIGVPYRRMFQMKRINELLSIRNEDNKIEIESEIYNILVSQMEETWNKQKNYGH